MIAAKSTNEEQVPVTINPKTDRGKPAEIDLRDGPPKWSVISGDATIQPSADGRSCMLVSGDNPGVSQILVEADADVGEGVQTISEIIEYTVEGARAANMGVSVGTPEPKPTTP